MGKFQLQPFGQSKNLFHFFVFFTLCIFSALSYQMVSYADLLSWDTQKYITDNVKIHKLNGSSLWWMLTSTYFNNWIPLTLFSHALDIQIFGFSPVGHHWVSVVWHVGCAWILYLYGLRILPKMIPMKGEYTRLSICSISFFASLLFALHPLRVESVAWVAERKDLLCGFYFLLCLMSYDSFRFKPTTIYYCLTLFFGLAAVMSKPMAISLPVVLLLLDLGLYKRVSIRYWQTQDWILAILEKLPLILISLFSVYMTLEAQSEAINSDISISTRIKGSIINWVRYLGITLVPNNLSPFYPFKDDMPWINVAFCLGAFFGLFVVAERFRRSGQLWLMMVLAFYSVTVLPVIGVISIGSASHADRYTYIPTMPFYFILAVLVFRILGICALKVKPFKLNAAFLVRLFVLVSLPIIFGFSTFQYTKTWKTDISLWETVKEKYPNSFEANLSLAEAYYFGGQLEEAVLFYKQVFLNRSMLENTKNRNRFIYRYFDAAFKLEQYEDAETIIYKAWREGRLWYLDDSIVFYESARVNIKMMKYDVALALLEKIRGIYIVNGIRVDKARVDMMKSEIQNLMGNQLQK